MHWKVKALLQKLLAMSRVGDKINHLYGSLQKDYYANGVNYGYHELLFKLDLMNKLEADSCSSLDKNALEIGTGYFLVQPIILRLLGWNTIITVDITPDISSRTLKKQLHYLLQDKYVSAIREKSSLTNKEFDDILDVLITSRSLEHVLQKCNIIYLAPYNFKDIESYERKFDFIFSQVVLEHIPPPVLDELFSYTSKWLEDNGCIIHIVNFTDHFTNPGLFGDRNISEFNFLKYSDRCWNFWAGNSIAYTNRLGYPYYYQLCSKYKLKVLDFIEQNYKKQIFLDTSKIHPDIISKYDTINFNDLTRVQRGVFVIKKN